MSLVSPMRIFQYIGLAAAARTLTSAWALPGAAGSTSSSRMSSGPPYL